ncbi:hypothetical protein NC653_040952 [Populus alba x Populus x berolinensis]|uniref:Uncharacterized protein n=1 Tax=Populus alba x Populus x berolinensis TaxID=444605 RepID=A0AAD6L7A2_9ROSI|nr:hypothetical protein NC653_040952 [Populus alba x Populus x berolinensis]
MPSAFLKILQTNAQPRLSIREVRSVQTGHKKMKDELVCFPLYDEIISLCVDLGELDAAIAIVADLETAGNSVPDQTP